MPCATNTPGMRLCRSLNCVWKLIYDWLPRHRWSPQLGHGRHYPADCSLLVVSSASEGSQPSSPRLSGIHVKNNTKQNIIMDTGAIRSCGSWHFMAPKVPDSTLCWRVARRWRANHLAFYHKSELHPHVTDFFIATFRNLPFLPSSVSVPSSFLLPPSSFLLLSSSFFPHQPP